MFFSRFPCKKFETKTTGTSSAGEKKTNSAFTLFPGWNFYTNLF
jgi:hypothetical protein